MGYLRHGADSHLFPHALQKELKYKYKKEEINSFLTSIKLKNPRDSA